MNREHQLAIGRLLDEIEHGRLHNIDEALIEHLAEWGPDGIDVQALASRVIERRDEG